MGFDKVTRNVLARTVITCRRKLIEDVTSQLGGVFGLHPDGTELSPGQLTHLTPDQLEAALSLRELLWHYAAGAAGTEQERKRAAYERAVLEISFTVLNRLAALRLCEERGLLIECVRKGTASDGFRLFEQVSGGALGSRYETYRVFLESVFDELSLDLGVLFDRFGPQSAVFPTEKCLEDLLSELNKPELTDLWKEDETIGWVYQYFNPQEERRAMREASQAPRNSRELAVRNQFFTPRYVVEFLTDNTLGRTWYEMRRGKTALAAACRYLVRRPDEVFLDKARSPEVEQAQNWLRGADVAEPDLWALAQTVNGYERSGPPGEGAQGFMQNFLARLRAGDQPALFTTQELLDLLFLFCRGERFSEGTIEGHAEESKVILDEVRRRVEKTKATDLPQEEMLKLPVFVPYRPKKDPRDIKVLDPACGSGHFLLYAFDLLEEIYREAWSDPESPVSEASGRTLFEDYKNPDGLDSAIPELIIRWNLHGIDIDPRAVQIAALALWLRAQKTWQKMGLKAPDRPPITKSNIVTAEPMPGEVKMLRQFTEGLRPTLLGRIVETVFEKMQLAGEAGSLLKIEEEIGEAIAEAKKQWLKGPKLEQQQLFPDAPKPQQQMIEFDFEGITDSSFWEQAEERIIDALKQYAEGTENGISARRRLFAEDTARGFAFVDLSRKRYDVVLMNPPFGNYPKKLEKEYKKIYREGWIDLYACFFIRVNELLNVNGYCGSISSRTYLYLRRMKKLRSQILLNNFIPILLVDLGSGVLDSAAVETCVSVFNNNHNNGNSIFLDLKSSNSKAVKLYHIVNTINNKNEVFNLLNTYICKCEKFNFLPDCVFAYDIDYSLLNLYVSLPTLENMHVKAYAGLTTLDNDRFLRLHWEIDSSSAKWVPFAKGGAGSKFYQNILLLINWGMNGKELKEKAKSYGGAASRFIASENYYFKPGLTYPRVGTELSVRILPKQCIFAEKGISIFFSYEERNENVTNEKLLALLAFLNSGIIEMLVSLNSPGRFWESGSVNRIPVPPGIFSSKLARIGIKGFHDSRSLYIKDETSRVFISPFILPVRSKIIDILNECDNEVNNLYKNSNYLFINKRIIKTENYEDNKNDVFSYALGCILGRWDIRISINPSILPELQKPFDPLPPCPPGMLVGPAGLPAEPGRIVSEEWLRARPDAGTLPPEGAVQNPTISDEEYPLRISWDGILVDDPGFYGGGPHRDDIVRRVREVLELLWGDRARAIEEEACEILGVSELREYFRRPAGFFQDHLKRYSKSRRKAPIYWPLSTASGSYTVWLYYHRVNDQTLYAAVNKYIEPKIAEVERGIIRMEKEIGEGGGRGASLRDRLNEGCAFLGELRELREELLRIAGLPYSPNLNDGVIISAAPLHKLFRLRSWARDTEECWKKLGRGDYDWAHLAYTLWPERVGEKCRKDCSIAIAHGREELYEEKLPAKGKGNRGKKEAGR